jgi:amino acid adenylation domain-containing protein
MASGAGVETIGARLAKVAARFPEQVAIAEGPAAINYRQLDAAATAIARGLLAMRSGGPERVCLFFASKSPAIQALFGAGRSGHAYVLLDAGDPEERLRSIALDSEPFALLTEESLAERARAVAPAHCPVIDIARLQTGDAAAFSPGVSPDAPVYLCYTSGSTGRPKGVIQTHRNLLFFADAYAQALEIGPRDRLSLLYTLSFNAANMDIFGGLLHGATLCAYDMRRDGIGALGDWLDRERITVLHSVPTVFRELGNRLTPGRQLQHLRVIDLGGETVFGTDIALFRAHTLDSCVLINQLACTEVGLIAQQIIEHGRSTAEGPIVPVGQCPPGVSVEIRRDDGGAADPGETGQIVVGSRHVSPGYWRRPELGAAAFSNDPTAPGGRRYFTGDFGRIDEEGALYFLGRRGGRVKIRGHTVELAEVEAALAACPGILKAAVLAVESGTHAELELLVAYLVAARAAERNPGIVRRRLESRLPSYMLPASYVFLEDLPLTPSGKIDRKMLAAIKRPEAGEREIEPPRDDLERSIADIFARMLKLSPIGRDDDFFLLGGDSLSMVELQTRLRDTFGAGLVNPAEDATVAGIAASIRRHRSTGAGARQPIPMLIALRRQGSKPPLFLVHGRLGQAPVSPHFLSLLGADQPVWAFQAAGLDGLQRPRSSIEAMAVEYVREVRRELPRGPYFLGGLCAGALVAVAMAHLLRDEGECVLPLLLLDPPPGTVTESDAALTDERLLARLRWRKRVGRSNAPIHDPEYASAAVRAARAFEHALRKHEPKPYDGPVCMLSTRERMTGGGSASLMRTFTGPVERFEVARTHDELLDAHNPAFEAGLMNSLRAIYRAAEEYAVARG